MYRYAVVNAEAIVENIVVWDGASAWSPPEGRSLVKVDNLVCNIGWKHENGTFTDLTPPAPAGE